MIYNGKEEYEIEFYQNEDGDNPVLEYIENLDNKIQAKIFKYIDFLKESRGILSEPYSKHIIEKIWELRVDFSNSRHRIFYFVFINKNIIFLHGFTKKTKKTPNREIKKALSYYQKIYEKTKQNKNRKI